MTNRLFELRKKANLTLRDVEKATGINFSNLAQIEKGKRKLTQEHIETLCMFFKVSPNYLLGYEEPIKKVEAYFYEISKIISREEAKTLIKYLEVYVNDTN